MAWLRFAVLALVTASCGCKKPRTETVTPGTSAPAPAASIDAGAAPAQPSGERTPALKPSDPMYERFEGTSFQNACGSDADCKPSGCSSEVCAAEAVTSTCEVVPKPPGRCGCVAGLCQWYR
jgi:eight-cysteine-cluster-containing protein